MLSNRHNTTHMAPKYAGKRLIQYLLDDGVWTAEAGANGIFYKYEDCHVPSWIVIALEQGPINKAVQKQLLSHAKRFAFVYAALDYGISPGILSLWVSDAEFTKKQADDYYVIISKYVKGKVKLTRFAERRDCGPFRAARSAPEVPRAVRKQRPTMWQGEEFTPEELAQLDAMATLERNARRRSEIEAEVEADMALWREMKRRRDAKSVMDDRLAYEIFDDELGDEYSAVRPRMSAIEESRAGKRKR